MAPPLAIRASAPRLPKGAPRNPMVFLDLQLNGAGHLAVCVAHERTGGLVLRMPTGPSGGPGFQPEPNVWELLAASALEAIRAKPEIYAHLTEAKRDANGRLTHKAIPEPATITPAKIWTVELADADD